MGATATPTAVPAYRLGQLLIVARQNAGCDLEMFAARSNFTVGELADIEAGHRLLNEQLIDDITSLYEVDCGPIVPKRARLTIDLNEGTVSAAGRAIRLDSDAHDHVLDRYLSLVYVMRGQEPGTQIALRERDLAILAASLAEREELILEQLERSMAQESDQVRGLVAWFKDRLWVPRAGILVSSVSIGTLVMVAGEPTAVNATELILPEPERPTPQRTRLVLPASIESGTIGAQLAASESPEEEPAGEATAPEAAQLGQNLGKVLSEQSTQSPALVEAANETSTPPAADASAPSVTTPEVVDAPQVETAPETAEVAAETPAATPAETPSEAIGRQAEALLPFEIADVLPGWSVTYKGSSETHRGLTHVYQQEIEIFIRPSDTPQSLAGILAHELGHAVDVVHLTNGHRFAWLAQRNLGGTPWWPSAYATDFQTGAGDFAEAFAYWTVGDASDSQIGGALDGDDIALLSSWLPWVHAA